MTDNPRMQELIDKLLGSQGTPEEVCRSCPELLPEIRERWRRLCRVRAELDALFPPLAESVTGPSTLLQEGMALPRIPGYDVEAVLGRGGMGVVYKARHLRLNRTVALKMLLAGAYAAPPELARFQREAEAVAGLRHANIVQVYDVADHEGRPYFTMEFVEGGSLAQKLAGVPRPARQAASLIVTLANAAQVAHQGGIVHRDLKPANILLAVDGTPKISDFGLARRLDGEASLTRTGTALGTPSYMAPEQAQGKTDALGPAADVYALGAILYELLTGWPPFRAETAAETVLQVLHQDPVPPSRLNAKVPRDLETICLKCLQKDPGKRYTMAAELAADLERFLKHESIQARPPGRLERCLRWVRRRPAAAGLMAAVVLLAASGGIGAWFLYEQQTATHAWQVQTDHRVSEVLEPARGLLEEGWLAHDLAKLMEARAEGNRAVDIARSGSASAAVQQEAEEFQEDCIGRLGRARRNRTLLESLLDVSAPQETSAYARDEAGWMLALAQPSVDEQYAEAFRRWGLDMNSAAEAEVTERLRQEPDVVVQELIAGLGGWMMVRRLQGRPEAEWRRLFRLAEALDRSERRRRLRAWLVGGSPPRAETVAGLVASGSSWPAFWELARGNAWRALREVREEINPRTEAVLTVLLLSRALGALGDAAGAEEVLRQATTARPNQVLLLDALGKLLEQQGPSRLEEAIGYYRAARGQGRQLGIALSKALRRAGRAREAGNVLQELILQQPENPAFYFYLGIAVFEQKKDGEAQTIFRKVIELKPDYAEAYYCLAIILAGQQKDGQAEAAYRKAIELKPDYPEAHNNLGNTLRRQGKLREAEAAYRNAIDLKPDLVKAHNNLGTVLFLQRKHGQAEAAYRKAIDLRPDYPEAYSDLGASLIRREKFHEAEVACRKAIDLEPNLAGAYSNLGLALNGQRKYALAEVACRKAIDLEPGLAEAHDSVGTALHEQGRHGEAEAAYRKATDLKPDFAQAYYNLGNALSAQSEYARAKAAYGKAVDLKPDYPEAHSNLGMVLMLQQKPSEAETALRKAIDLKPDFGLGYHNLGMALMQQARFHEADASLKKAADLLPARDPRRENARQLQQRCQRFVTLDARLPAIQLETEKPADAAEQIEFAQLCILKKLYAAAARLYADAFTMKPQLAEEPAPSSRYSAACSAALAGCGRGEDGAKLGDAERTHWRDQAREWLRADLTALGKVLDGAPAARDRARQTLTYWRGDPDLAGLREPDALERLSVVERDEWLALWTEVDALLKRTTSP